MKLVSKGEAERSRKDRLCSRGGTDATDWCLSHFSSVDMMSPLHLPRKSRVSCMSVWVTGSKFWACDKVFGLWSHKRFSCHCVSTHIYSGCGVKELVHAHVHSSAFAEQLCGLKRVLWPSTMWHSKDWANIVLIISCKRTRLPLLCMLKGILQSFSVSVYSAALVRYLPLFFNSLWHSLENQPNSWVCAHFLYPDCGAAQMSEFVFIPLIWAQNHQSLPVNSKNNKFRITNCKKKTQVLLEEKRDRSDRFSCFWQNSHEQKWQV